MGGWIVGCVCVCEILAHLAETVESVNDDLMKNEFELSVKVLEEERKQVCLSRLQTVS